MDGGSEKMRWKVNRRNGCINMLEIDHEAGNLVEWFGWNEYATCPLGGKVNRRKQIKPDKIKVQRYFDKVDVTGLIGVQRFSTEYVGTKGGLLINVNREYLDDVVDLYDDSICFICPRGWYKRFRLYTPTSKYYEWWEEDEYFSSVPIESEWNPSKPMRGQNLFAEACVGGWGEILGSKGGLRFEILDFSGGDNPQFHIVEFPKRKYVEFEFTYDIRGTRQRGDKQMLKLLIKEVRV